MTTFTETITLIKMDCGKCGGTYAINDKFNKHRQEIGGVWWCPYCQCSWGYAEGENNRLKRQVAVKEAELRAAKCETLRERQLREAAENSASKAERKVSRALNGTCPLCRRSFRALRRHMAEKHPTATKCQKELRLAGKK